MPKYLNNTGVGQLKEIVEETTKALADCFIDDVTFTTYRTADTDCYVVEIPKEDDAGNTIIPYLHYDTERTPSELARDENTTFTSNAMVNLLKTDDEWQVPNCVSMGEVIYSSNLSGTPVANDTAYLSINEDRTYNTYPITYTAEQLVSAGGYNVINTYYSLVSDGEAVDLSDTTANEVGRVTNPNPNMAIGFKQDLTIVIFGCDGRTANNVGLTSAQVATQLIALGCVDGWMLDGGGSESINYRGCKVNRDYDDEGTTDRMIRFSLNVQKPDATELLQQTYKTLNDAIALAQRQAVQDINGTYSAIDTDQNVLTLSLSQTSDVMLYRYYGADTSWLPNQRDMFIYGFMLAIKHGDRVIVRAFSYNGEVSATNIYTLGAWQGWTITPKIHYGSETVAGPIAANSTGQHVVNLSGMSNTNYTVVATCGNTTWAVPFVVKALDKVTFNIRNLSASNQLSNIVLNWCVIEN